MKIEVQYIRKRDILKLKLPSKRKIKQTRNQIDIKFKTEWNECGEEF